MREIKHILHAFLFLLASIGVFICLKAFYSSPAQISKVVLIDRQTFETKIFLRGKELFQSKCGSCHVLFRQSTGPSLCGFESRGPWTNRENVYQWINNPMEFMKKDQYTRELKESFGGTMMTAFPELAHADIDEIINYINNTCAPLTAKN